MVRLADQERSDGGDELARPIHVRTRKPHDLLAVTMLGMRAVDHSERLRVHSRAQRGKSIAREAPPHRIRRPLLAPDKPQHEREDEDRVRKA